jgi:hypothetical protein
MEVCITYHKVAKIISMEVSGLQKKIKNKQVKDVSYRYFLILRFRNFEKNALLVVEQFFTIFFETITGSFLTFNATSTFLVTPPCQS